LKTLSRDNLPHQVNCLAQIVGRNWHTLWARLAAYWWGVHLGHGCAFFGQARFRRHPDSLITIGSNCWLRSSPASNLIGVNRPCIISTLKEGAELRVGDGCGFSGTVLGCARRIVIGRNVRCGANTLITDTDWHGDDPRTESDAAVEIGDDVWLGVNVTVLKGVTIGKGTLVGACSLVTRSLPPGVIAAGVPAKVLRRLEDGDGRVVS
jgi:UDP-3-O-[3-hydroxymyristoyl] glucosamine N-acyltransferase